MAVHYRMGSHTEWGLVRKGKFDGPFNNAVLSPARPLVSLPPTTAPPEMPSPSKQNSPMSASETLTKEAEQPGKEIKLTDHETNGGHTISKHIRSRDGLLTDSRRETRYISAFDSKESAEKWISMAMSKNNDAIAAWSLKADSFDKQAFQYHTDSVVGYGAGPKDNTTTQLYSLVVVLRKMPDGQKHILTSYPVRRR